MHLLFCHIIFSVIRSAVTTNDARCHNREEDAETNMLRHNRKQSVCQQSVADGLIHTSITSWNQYIKQTH